MNNKSRLKSSKKPPVHVSLSFPWVSTNPGTIRSVSFVFSRRGGGQATSWLLRSWSSYCGTRPLKLPFWDSNAGVVSRSCDNYYVIRPSVRNGGCGWCSSFVCLVFRRLVSLVYSSALVSSHSHSHRFFLNHLLLNAAIFILFSWPTMQSQTLTCRE